MKRLLLATLVFALTPSWAIDIPRKAPEFAIKMPNGKELLLSSFRGKVVVCEFLFTTCPHCQDASRVMSKLQNEYGPRGFQAVGVAFNEMAMMLVPEFVQNFGATYPVGVGSREAVMDFLQYTMLMRLMVPQIVIIDRSGSIRAQTPVYTEDPAHPQPNFASEENLRANIEKLLAEGPKVSSNAPKRLPMTKKKSM